MRTKYIKSIFHLTVFISVATFGCSSPAVDSANNSAARNGNSLVNVPVVDFNASGPSGANVNSANAQNLGANPTTNPDTNAAPIAVPAPDDSEYSMQLTDVGTETRTFKNHPQIIKAVRTITPNNETIQVFLRNGQVVNVPKDKIASIGAMRMAAPANFLVAAGVKPPPPTKEEQEMFRQKQEIKKQEQAIKQ